MPACGIIWFRKCVSLDSQNSLPVHSNTKKTRGFVASPSSTPLITSRYLDFVYYKRERHPIIPDGCLPQSKTSIIPAGSLFFFFFFLTRAEDNTYSVCRLGKLITARSSRISASSSLITTPATISLSFPLFISFIAFGRAWRFCGEN